MIASRSGPAARRPVGPSAPRPAGTALLDVLAALAILGTAGLALTGLVHQAIRAQAASERAERTLDEADRVLSALTLLAREDLDRRLGTHPLGEFLVNIQRPERTLYRIAIAETAAPERLLLVTVLHRAQGKP